MRPMKRGVRLCSMLLCLAFGQAHGATAPSHRLSATVMQCRVDPTKPLRTVPAALFGTNLEWFNGANGIARWDGSTDPAWARLLSEQGADNIRFPGGTLSDFYHWEDGIGPIDQRPIRAHPTDSGRSPNVFGTPEFARFCKSSGTRPLITVNAGTGTAEEAARWVAYCNQASDARRLADGLAEPIDVKLWEVGNELYLPGNPGDAEIITVTPETYSERFNSFATAMRAVDPSIKLMAIGTANSSVVGLPYPNWSETLLSRAAEQMDYIAVHNCYFPMTFAQPGAAQKDLYQSLWASPEAVNRSLTALSSLITRYEKGRRIEIAVTEWGALFSFAPGEVDQVKTLGSAVYLARAMQVFLKQPRVTLANYFKFTDRSFMGWVGYDQKPKVPYYVIQLFSKHFGTQVVQASIDSPKFSSKAVGVAAAENNVPELTVVASLDASGSRLFINIVNRSWSTIHQVKFNTGTFQAAPNALTWRLGSPLLTDNNGRDMAPEIPTALYVEPPVSPDAALPITIVQGSQALDKALLVPPYSIVTVELSRK